MGFSRRAGQEGGPVGRMMDRWPAVLPATAGVRDSVARLTSEGRDCAVVEDADGQWIGIITLETLLREREAQHRADPTAALFRVERGATAEDLMIPAWLAVAEEAPLHLAAALMADEHVGHLPVVDREGRIVGTVSAFDVLGSVACDHGYRVTSNHATVRRDTDEERN